MHGMIVGVTETEHILTRTKKHMTATPISIEEYLRNEISKTNTPQTADRCNDLMEYFPKLNEHKHSKMYKTSEGNISKITFDMELVLILFPRKVGQNNNNENVLK